jgi:hypothetical protein
MQLAAPVWMVMPDLVACRVLGANGSRGLAMTHDWHATHARPWDKTKGFRQIVGGFGSGRRFRWDLRTLVEHCFVLNVAVLAGRPLTPGDEGTVALRSAGCRWEWPAQYLVRRLDGFVLTLWRRVGDGVVRQDIPIVASALVSGGERAYFRCPGKPGQPCGWRVAKLYAPRFGALPFAFRACHRLAYRSSQTRRHHVWVARLKADVRAAGRL